MGHQRPRLINYVDNRVSFYFERGVSILHRKSCNFYVIIPMKTFDSLLWYRGFNDTVYSPAIAINVHCFVLNLIITVP